MTYPPKSYLGMSLNTTIFFGTFGFLSVEFRKREKVVQLYVQGGLDPNKISDLGADFGIIVR